MYLHNSLLPAQSALFVSVNSTNQYIATASLDGNICIRSVQKINELYENTLPLLDANGSSTAPTDKTLAAAVPIISTVDSSSNVTKPLHEISDAPEMDKVRLEAAQKMLHIVGVRSRSKISTLKYANLVTNANLLAAVYKNGEVYIITNPQDPSKCRIQQIFKHANGLLLDFCWSADDQLMAFSSINNEVIIYDVIYGKIIANLHLHINTEIVNSKDGSTEEVSTAVKGITFDKVHNAYLYTLGDDRILNVVRYRLVNDDVLGRRFDYEIVQELYDIINSSKLNKASIRKISISSDDKMLTCPNTFKSKNMRITLLRNTNGDAWKKLDEDFIANGLKCFLTMFNPCKYKNSQGEIVYVIAAISNDSGFAIWRSDLHQPLYIFTNIPPTILDVCWSADGTKLFLTHTNGTMMVLVFQKGEFGTLYHMLDPRVEELHKRTREILPLEFEKMTRWRTYIKDHPLLVKQKEEERIHAEIATKRVRMIDAKANEGKKQDSVQSLGEIGSSTPQLASQVPSNVSSHSDSSKLETIPPIVPALPLGLKNGNGNGEKVNVQSNADDSKQNGTSKNQGKGKSLDKGMGKIKEQSTSKMTTAEKDKELKLNNKPSTISTKKRPLLSSNYDLPSGSVPKDLNSKVTKMLKSSSSNETNSTSTKKKRDTEPLEFVGSVIINPQLSFSNIRVAIPKTRTNITYKLPDDDSVSLVIKNGNGLESQPTRISLMKHTSNSESKQLFADFIPHKVHIVCGSSKFLAISTSNGQIITYSESGRRVLPPIVLGCPLSFLEMKDRYLLAVTSVGEMYVWDLTELKSCFKPISLYPLLQPLYSSGQVLASNNQQNTNSADITSDLAVNANVNTEGNGLVFVNGELLTRSENLTVCSITEQGIPVVTLTNGNGYLFNKDMSTWSLISDSWWAFGSQYWDSSLSTEHMKDDVGLLEYLESQTNEEINRKGKAKFFTKISKMMLMREGYENLETVISLNHLENKINFYLMLDDYKNFKMLLITYSKRLSELNLKNRLLEIFNGLFVDMSGVICGHSKRQLLEDLLLSCSKHREVQHILVQYSESIGLLSRAEDSDIDII